MIQIKKIPLIIIVIFILSVITMVPQRLIAKASSDQSFIPTLAMPKEYINYTITSNNEQLWAKIYGKYPINVTNPKNEMVSFQMFYPIPLNTKNIKITLNKQEVDWFNYTQKLPNTIHHTAIGNWPMIQCTLENVSNSFLLEIQYEHPIQKINGKYVFLYDLNISPYLSIENPNSAAYFTLIFQIDITEIQAFTAKTDTSWNPIEFAEKQNSAKVVTIQIESFYSKPLLGDLIVSFNYPDLLATQNIFVIVVSLTIITVLVLYFYFKKVQNTNLGLKNTNNQP